MTDLRDRFQSLDQWPAPDLWNEVTERAALPERRSEWRLPTMNRFAPLALTATLVVALLLGISLMLRPPTVGPPATSEPPDGSPTASVADSPFVGGTHWEILSFDAGAIPEPGSAGVGWYLHFGERAETVLFDPGCAELRLAVRLDPRGPAIRLESAGEAPLCGTVQYVRLVQQMVEALTGVERWQSAGEAFELVGTGSTIQVRLVDCTTGASHPGDVDLECFPPTVIEGLDGIALTEDLESQEWGFACDDSAPASQELQESRCTRSMVGYTWEVVIVGPSLSDVEFIRASVDSTGAVDPDRAAAFLSSLLSSAPFANVDTAAAANWIADNASAETAEVDSAGVTYRLSGGADQPRTLEVTTTD